MKSRKKRHSREEMPLLNLVAWGGIEPPTQGFSTPYTPAGAQIVSPRNVRLFCAFGGCSPYFAEGVAEGFRALWCNRHPFSPYKTTK
jgi:hypothetical protein